MEKERLTIGESKVTVEYEFLNDTDKNITTEVAFPIPPTVINLMILSIFQVSMTFVCGWTARN
jgi:hypothetical protein